MSSFNLSPSSLDFFFFFNDTATTEIYTLSLHDALPISFPRRTARVQSTRVTVSRPISRTVRQPASASVRSKSRSEEHTSELQSLAYLVCRLLLEKKKKSMAYNNGKDMPNYEINIKSISS